MVKGFKVFNPDWTCSPKGGKTFQYAVGGIYTEDVTPNVCEHGFHFCEKAADCFNYYSFNPKNKVAEVMALGEVDTNGVKSCTNKIQIIREIPWDELLKIVNTGTGCTGHHNTGHYNTGHHNTGYYNTGHHNTGHYNTGDHNTGYCNAGDYNTGYCNTGHYNTGDHNTGYCNAGDYNTGYCNQSKFCSGDFNLVDCETGCFCTEPHTIRFFDKGSELTIQEWRNSEAFNLIRRINFTPLKWVCAVEMSDDEKKQHPEYETTGGYLKFNDLTHVYQDWWDGLTDSEKAIIRAIPNFDPAKFEKITGIVV